MQSRDQQEVERASWWDLCRQALAEEEDPVRFLDVTMQITKFLARKQQRLDAAFDEAQQIQQAQQPGSDEALKVPSQPLSRPN